MKKFDLQPLSSGSSAGLQTSAILLYFYFIINCRGSECLIKLWETVNWESYGRVAFALLQSQPGFSLVLEIWDVTVIYRKSWPMNLREGQICPLTPISRSSIILRLLQIQVDS